MSSSSDRIIAARKAFAALESPREVYEALDLISDDASDSATRLASDWQTARPDPHWSLISRRLASAARVIREAWEKA